MDKTKSVKIVVIIRLEMRLSRSEKALLKAIQNGMPLTRTPYQDLAGNLGIPMDDLLAMLRQWQTDGRIRRVGAVVNHFHIGSGCGAMVVWSVPDDQVASVGTLFAVFEKVSHVYQRSAYPNWPYNLYTMVHAADSNELDARIRDMSDKSGITGFRVLKTIRELKKVPPTYITE